MHIGDADYPLLLEITVDDLECQVMSLQEDNKKIQDTQTNILKQMKVLTTQVDELSKQLKTQITPAINSWDMEDDIEESYAHPYSYNSFSWDRKYAQSSYPHVHQTTSNTSQIHYQTSSHSYNPPPTHNYKEQPQCTAITFNSNNSKRCPPLSLDAIDLASLLPPELVKQKYPKLRGPERAGELAVKLAVEAFFGPSVLARCTVAGCRQLPGLPVEQLQKLKQFIYRLTPQFWDNPGDFDHQVWSTCTASINQKCKALRKAQNTSE